MTHRNSRLLLCLTLAFLSPCALARNATSEALQPDARVELDAVVITGTLPAPGLWELSRGDKHLLIMGTLSPSPRDMVWNAPRVEKAVGKAQEVLGTPGVSIGADVGLFRGLMLIPAYQRSKKNPDGRTLGDVLPTPTYARWQVAKARYLPGDDDVEQLRPLYAAGTLFDAAARAAGLTQEDRVEPVVRRIARAHDIPVRATALRLVIKDPKQTLKQLSTTTLDDVPCLEQTLDRLQVDVQTMVSRANAWAEGDMARMHALPFTDQKQACLGAFANNEVARAQGITNLDGAIQGAWLEAAHDSLARNDVVFALVPVGRLESPGGILDALRNEGFVVKAPE